MDFEVETKPEEYEERRTLLGRCGCKARCAREQGEEKPRRLGVCDIEAPDDLYLEPSGSES